MTSIFENPIFLISISSGFIFMIAGFVMFKFPPKEVNSFYGYRTNSSMKSQERWNFAQRYSAIEMMKLGVLLSLIGLLGVLFSPNEALFLFIVLGLLILMVVVFFIRVEKAIKKEFENK